MTHRALPLVLALLAAAPALAQDRPPDAATAPPAAAPEPGAAGVVPPPPAAAVPGEAPAPAPRKARRPRLLGEIGYAAGASDGFAVGPFAQLTGRAGWLALGGSIRVASPPVGGGRRTDGVLFLAEAGAVVPVAERWSVLALGVAGAHVVSTMNPDAPALTPEGNDTNSLGTVGARVGVERLSGGDDLFVVALGLSATVTRDLGTKYDTALGREVGGTTVLVSASIGLGL